MPTWDSTQYRRFEKERTQPAMDLCRRIEIGAPKTAIDLGCGPGNSSAVLAERWTSSEILGLDSSPAMLEAAAREHPRIRFEAGDIATWSPKATYDVVFSNAALQWVPDHGSLLPRLIQGVSEGGALAFQVPADPNATPHRLMRDLADSENWRAKFPQRPREWHVESTGFYYDALAPLARRLDLWTTEYVHIVENARAIVAWYRGTGLRPWLDVLSGPAEREHFLDDYEKLIASAYPAQHDGRFLFSFKRLFAIAYR